MKTNAKLSNKWQSSSTWCMKKIRDFSSKIKGSALSTTSILSWTARSRISLWWGITSSRSCRKASSILNLKTAPWKRSRLITQGNRAKYLSWKPKTRNWKTGWRCWQHWGPKGAKWKVQWWAHALKYPSTCQSMMRSWTSSITFWWPQNEQINNL